MEECLYVWCIYERFVLVVDYCSKEVICLIDSTDKLFLVAYGILEHKKIWFLGMACVKPLQWLNDYPYTHKTIKKAPTSGCLSIAHRN